MLTREILVRGRSVYANGDTTLVRTSIGVYQMHVLFDASEWLGFPVQVVFGYGEHKVTQTLVLAAVSSDEWAAESTIEIPWETMAELGSVRLTFQGTTGGDHIITAESGNSLWSVVQEGDVTDGTVPTPAPTTDEWNQAYADAMAAANDAASAASDAGDAALRAQNAAILAEQVLEDGIPLMDAQTRGGAKAGAGVEVDATEHLNLLPATASSIGGVTVDDSTIESTDGELSVKVVPADKLTGTISADNLPSYVDDVEEYATVSDFPATGETGKIYVALDSNASYRWGGSSYIRVASGENATTTTDGLMSHADKAKLDAAPDSYGDGLSLASDTLNLGPLTKSGQGASVETDGCAIFGITGEGWAEQQSTTGKNLWPSSNGNTSNGVVFTVLPDGGIRADNQASDLAFHTIDNVQFASGVYVLSGCPSGGGDSTYQLRIVNTDTQTNVATDSGSGAACNLEAGVNYSLRIRIASGYTASNLVFHPQLETGSQATSWEPYTGGKPAPSPEYPQPIRVCKGRNLLPYPAAQTLTQNGLTLTTDGKGRYHLQGTATASASFILALPQSVTLESGEYLHLHNDALVTGVAIGLPGLISPTANTINRVYQIPDSQLGTSSEFQVYVANGATVNLNFSPMLMKSATPMPYVPYGHVGLQVGQGGTEYKSGYAINASGIESANADYKIIKIENPTSSMLAVVTGSNSVSTTRFHAYGPSGWMAQLAERDGNGNVVFSVPSGATEIRVSILKLGSVALSTVTPVPLPSKGWTGAAGDIADALSIDSAGRWEWDVDTAEVLLDGTSTEGSATTSYNGGKDIRFGNITVRKPTPGTVPSIYAEIGIAITGAEVWNGTKEGFSVSDTSNLNAHFDAVSSHHDMNALLVLHPSTVLYPLAAPTTETGYVDLPDLPLGAVVSIPELEQIGVSWWIEGAEAAVEHGNNVLRRAQAENEFIENALADLAARVAALEA